jgi:ABC-type proline/glycine betaine transport system permease subunit
MSPKRSLRIVGWVVLASVVYIVVMCVYATAGELVVWAVKALWQRPSESQKLVVVAVLILVGTLIGIRMGALSTRKYRLKNPQLDDDGSDHVDDKQD